MTKYFFMSALMIAGFQVHAADLTVNENGLYDADGYEEQIRASDAAENPMNIAAPADSEQNLTRPGGGGGRGGGGWNGGGGHRPRPPGRGGGFPVPIPVPVPVPAPSPRWVTCFAENARGQTFSGTARYPRAAQNRAMNNCRSVSAVCRPMGCR